MEQEAQQYRVAVHFLKKAVASLEQAKTASQPQSLEPAFEANMALLTSSENLKASSYRLGQCKVNNSALLSIVQDSQQIVETDVRRAVVPGQGAQGTPKMTVSDMLARISKLASVLPDNQLPNREQATSINRTLEEIRLYK